MLAEIVEMIFKSMMMTLQLSLRAQTVNNGMNWNNRVAAYQDIGGYDDDGGGDNDDGDNGDDDDDDDGDS